MDLSVVIVTLIIAGPSTAIWTVVSLGRLIGDRRVTEPSHRAFYLPADVAVLVAAHDEALVIAATIRSAARSVPHANIFVVSDGSHDDTAAIARTEHATVLELRTNRGKAGAIRAAITAFSLPERFPILLLLDADTRLRDDYLATGLPLFDARDVVAVAGRATTARATATTRLGRFLTAYRERVYICTQYLQKFGQAAPWADAVTIVPGFASMYRIHILDRIDIDAPGLSIEDFNMTFEVHAKRLGRIAFHPAYAVAETQDPVTVGDYARQVRRWCLGFWQTVGRHRPGLSIFWFAVLLFVVETLVSSVVLVLVPAAILLLLLVAVLGAVGGSAASAVGGVDLAPVGAVLVAFLLMDIALTLVASALARTWPTPGAVFFPLMRVLDAWLCLVALWLAGIRRPSSGRWLSPPRRAAVADAAARTATVSATP